MRPRIAFAGLMLTLAGSLAAPAYAEDEYRHGRLLFVEPGVSLQRATGVGAEEADVNEPFLPGDRVWTNAAGRAEFQFPDGSLARLDRRSKLDYSGHEEDGGERIVLRLWSGSLYSRVRARDARFEIETPAGTARGLERSLMRIDVDAGEVRVSVYEGEALFDDGQVSMRLAAGERTYARWGERAEEPQRFDLDEADDFDRWNADQEAQERWDGRSARYLPDELDAYASELDSYGDWRYETTAGYVWVPRVEVDWRPYWRGRWCWTPYGWTWVPYERWGWAPSHYGRWGHASFGWYWIPDRTWGPAWVSWAVGGGYVGWCPLGWRDRPVRDWDHRRYDRGHAAPRRGRGAQEFAAWNVVRQGELGYRDLAQRRVSIDRIDPAALQVAASARLRPTRDALRLREGEATVRAISTRPTPGDFVRELAVDNKTTIRSPWFRSGEAVRRGEPQIRNDRGDAAGRATAGARRRSDDEAAATGGMGRVEERRPTPQRRATWFTPSSGGPNRDAAGPSGSPAGAERRESSGSEGRESSGAERRSLRREPESRETRSLWFGPTVQPRTREQASVPPPARIETEHRQRDAQSAPRVWGGSERPRSNAGAESRQRETSGAGTHAAGGAASAQPRAGAPRGETRSSGGGHAQGGGNAERRNRR